MNLLQLFQVGHVKAQSQLKVGKMRDDPVWSCHCIKPSLRCSIRRLIMAADLIMENDEECQLVGRGGR